MDNGTGVLEKSVARDPLFDIVAELDQTSREVVSRYAKRALDRQSEGRPVTELAVFHDGQAATMEYGLVIQKNLLFEDPPDFDKQPETGEFVELPRDYIASDMTLKEVLKARRSKRDYQQKPLTLSEISTVLYLAYGVRATIDAYGKRAVPLHHAPSGGGLLSGQIYFVALNVEGLAKGVYRYHPRAHVLECVSEGEIRWKIYELCSSQDWIAKAPALFFLVTDLDQLEWKYRERSYRLGHLDAGVLAQNLHLAATSIGLGSCIIFGFEDEQTNHFLDVDGDRQFVSLALTVGWPVEPMPIIGDTSEPLPEANASKNPMGPPG